MTIPIANGGQAASYLDAMLMIESISKRYGVAGRNVAEADMGGAVKEYRDEPRKRLASEMVLTADKSAICVTEPGAGCSASEMAMPDRPTPNANTT